MTTSTSLSAEYTMHKKVKNSTSEEAVKIFIYSCKESEMTFRDSILKLETGLSRYGINVTSNFMVNDDRHLIKHLTNDDRNSLHDYILEAVFDLNAEIDAIKIPVKIHLTIVKSGTMKGGARVSLKDCVMYQWYHSDVKFEFNTYFRDFCRSSVI